MSGFVKTTLWSLLAGLMLSIAPATEAPAQDRYWNQYWGWYDNDYRPYQYRNYYRNRDRYRDDRYYDRGYYRSPTRERYYYRQPQGQIRVGPFGLNWY